MNKIGNFLAALRKEKGYTQQEVADALNVSNKTVSKWERSEGYPEIETLIDLAELYNISVDELLAGERTKIKCTDSLEILLTLDFEKKKIYSLFISLIALFIFFSIYFYTKDFSLSFFIYLALMCLSFMFLMLGLLKLKKYHIKKKFIYFEWIRNFICLSIFIFPCIGFMLILTPEDMIKLLNQAMNLQPLANGVEMGMNGVTFNAQFFITFTDYLRLLPIILFSSFLLFQFSNLIKNSLFKKANKFHFAFISLLLFLFIGNICYQVYTIEKPNRILQMTETDYTSFKRNFLKIYTFHQEQSDNILEEYVEEKEIDFAQINGFLSSDKQIEKYANIKKFDDANFTVVYKTTLPETFDRVEKSIIFTSLFSSILLIINIFFLIIAYRKGKPLPRLQ